MTMKRKTNLFTRCEKREIIYKAANSLLGGALVFLGAFSDGLITETEIYASIGAAAVIAVTKFKEYLDGEEHEYINSITNFL